MPLQQCLYRKGTVSSLSLSLRSKGCWQQHTCDHCQVRLMQRNRAKHKSGHARGASKRWIASVHTDSTHPQPGLFTKEANTIARALASRKVSPKGPSSGMRMLTYFINRARKGLSRKGGGRSWNERKRCYPSVSPIPARRRDDGVQRDGSPKSKCPGKSNGTQVRIFTYGHSRIASDRSRLYGARDFAA